MFIISQMSIKIDCSNGTNSELQMMLPEYIYRLFQGAHKRFQGMVQLDGKKSLAGILVL